MFPMRGDDKAGSIPVFSFPAAAFSAGQFKNICLPHLDFLDNVLQLDEVLELLLLLWFCQVSRSLPDLSEASGTPLEVPNTCGGLFMLSEKVTFRKSTERKPFGFSSLASVFQVRSGRGVCELAHGRISALKMLLEGVF